MEIDPENVPLPRETVQRIRERGAMPLLRFLGADEHVEEFMSGSIRFGHLQGYREADKARKDENEGIRVRITSNALFWLGGIDLSGSDVTEKLTYAGTEFLYALCLMAPRTSSVSRVLNVEHLIEIGRKWGEKCVVVLDGMSFWERCLDAVKAEDRLFAGPVEYYEPRTATATTNPSKGYKREKRLWDNEFHLQCAFRKTRDYISEQEYRIVLEREPPPKEKMYLHVPPLSDIAYVKDIGK